MITPFRLWTLAAVIVFILLGIVHREAPAPDPTAALIAKLRVDGHIISKSKIALWGTPGFAFSVADCPQPVDAVLFDFDEILSPGMIPAVQALKRGTMRVSYDGNEFDSFDRGALYRLRFRDGIGALLHGRLADPPIILLFWPTGCAPAAVP